VILLIGGLVWWYLVGREQSETANHFRKMHSVIDEQQRRLDGITETITDPIALTDAKGVFTFVNMAFAKLVGRDKESILGLDTAAVFGFRTAAERLTPHDHYVLKTG
jgi:PAS domain-containing protein